MATITTRAGKGAPLSWTEADANFINLNTDKVEVSEIGVSVQAHSSNLDSFATITPTVAGLALLDDVDNAAQRTTLGLGSAATTSSSDYATAAQGTLAGTALQPSVIGVSVQAYDANTAKTNVAQNFTLPQRSALLTDNDGSFDLAVKQNFKCTTAGAVTLTFANQADGLSGSVIFVNASNHTVSAHANTKLTAADLSKLSVTGTYRIDYLSNGTNAYCSVVGAYT